MSEEPMNFILDEIREEDAPVLAAWFNDPSLCRFMEDSEPDKSYSLDDVFSMMREPSNSVYLTLRRQNVLVGYASLYDFNQGTAEFSFMIGNPEFRGRRVGGLLVQLLCDKARMLGLKKLTCSVVSENQPSIRCVQKNGFEPVSPAPSPEIAPLSLDGQGCEQTTPLPEGQNFRKRPEFFFQKHL